VGSCGSGRKSWREAELVTGKWAVRKLGEYTDDEHFLSLRPLTPYRSLSSLMQVKIIYEYIFFSLYTRLICLYSQYATD
jgi:hypothetical protein